MRRFRGVLAPTVVAVAVVALAGCSPSESISNTTTTLSPPEPIAEPTIATPLEVFPRRPGAQAADVELRADEAYWLGIDEQLWLQSVTRTGPLGDRVRVPGVSPRRFARADSHPAAFAPRGVDDPSSGLRVRFGHEGGTDSPTPSDGSLTLPVWLGRCVLIAPDGRVFSTYSEHPDMDGGSANFAIGQLVGPFDLVCDLVTIFESHAARVVWRIDV